MASWYQYRPDQLDHARSLDFFLTNERPQLRVLVVLGVVVLPPQQIDVRDRLVGTDVGVPGFSDLIAADRQIELTAGVDCQGVVVEADGATVAQQKVFGRRLQDLVELDFPERQRKQVPDSIDLLGVAEDLCDVLVVLVERQVQR